MVFLLLCVISVQYSCLLFFLEVVTLEDNNEDIKPVSPRIFFFSSSYHLWINCQRIKVNKTYSVLIKLFFFYNVVIFKAGLYRRKNKSSSIFAYEYLQYRLYDYNSFSSLSLFYCFFVSCMNVTDPSFPQGVALLFWFYFLFISLLYYLFFKVSLTSISSFSLPLCFFSIVSI